jgi:hypothetical protein
MLRTGAPPTQAITRMYQDYVPVFPREPAGVAPFWKAVRSARHVVRLYIKGLEAVVDVRGFSALDRTFQHICVP